MLRRALSVVLLLAVASALSPAVATVASPAAALESTNACDLAEPATSCASICQAAKSAGTEHAQTSSAGGCAMAVPSRAVLVPGLGSSVATRDEGVAPDRAAFLRFQRFLL